MEAAGISCWASRFESRASRQESPSLTSLGRSNTDRSQGVIRQAPAGLLRVTALSVPQAGLPDASQLAADSPVLQSYPLTEPPDGAGLTALLILGQNTSPWDHGA